MVACVEKSRQEIKQKLEARSTSDKEKEDLRKEFERFKKDLEYAKNTEVADNRNCFGRSNRNTRS